MTKALENIYIYLRHTVEWLRQDNNLQQFSILYITFVMCIQQKCYNNTGK